MNNEFAKRCKIVDQFKCFSQQFSEGSEENSENFNQASRSVSRDL